VRAAKAKAKPAAERFDQTKCDRGATNANETDRESRNAVVGPLAHLDGADSVAKSKPSWTRSSSSRPGHSGGCLDHAGAIGGQGKCCGNEKGRGLRPWGIPSTSFGGLRYTTSIEQFEVPIAAPRGPVLFRQVARLNVYFGNLDSYLGYTYFGDMNDQRALDVRFWYPHFGQLNVYLGYLQF
jgi:hypothetical protein